MPSEIRYSPASLDRSYQTPELVNQRRITLEKLSLSPGAAVLDIGCGSGLLTRAMAEQVGSRGRVLAVDKSADMVAATAERCADLGQATAMEGDISALPGRDGEFDAVTCTQVLLYVPDVAAALMEIARVLRPGGRLAIIETDWGGVVMHSSHPELTDRIYRAWDQAVPSPRLPARLGRLMKDAGFTPVETTPIPLLNTDYSSPGFSVTSIDWLRRNAVRQDAITEQESELWRQDLESLGARDDYFFCVNRFLFLGIRGQVQAP
jgi:SAM-dependent methyltransferase